MDKKVRNVIVFGVALKISCVVFPLIILTALLFVCCHDDRLYTLPQTSRQIENTLEERYDKDFEIKGSEKYHSETYYKFYDESEAVTFYASSQLSSSISGFGWMLYENYDRAVFAKYANLYAEENKDEPFMSCFELLRLEDSINLTQNNSVCMVFSADKETDIEKCINGMQSASEYINNKELDGNVYFVYNNSYVKSLTVQCFDSDNFSADVLKTKFADYCYKYNDNCVSDEFISQNRTPQEKSTVYSTADGKIIMLDMSYGRLFDLLKQMNIETVGLVDDFSFEYNNVNYQFSYPDENIELEYTDIVSPQPVQSKYKNNGNDAYCTDYVLNGIFLSNIELTEISR